MNELKFNSQVCTTQKQSRKLLALGLKSTTADCHYTRLTVDSFATTPTIMPPNLGDLPAWSLHKLIEIYLSHFSNASLIFRTEQNPYELLISDIEQMVEDNFFNKQYLNE